MVRIQLWAVTAALWLLGPMSTAGNRPEGGAEKSSAVTAAEASDVEENGELGRGSMETASPIDAESTTQEQGAVSAAGDDKNDASGANPTAAGTTISPSPEASKRDSAKPATAASSAVVKPAVVASNDPTETSSAPENASDENDAQAENKRKKSLKVPSRNKRPKLISVGLSAPLCGFAEGLITGSGWVNTSSEFIWGNLDVRFLVRMAERFAIGGGITQSLVLFEDTVTLGGAFVADIRWYAVPDYLYFKLNLYVGFPLMFALAPAMGHSFEITPKVHLYIENQFVLMIVAGAYGFWQPAVGAEIRF